MLRVIFGRQRACDIKWGIVDVLLQIIIHLFSVSSHRFVGDSEDIYERYFAPVPPKGGATTSVQGHDPKSKGSPPGLSACTAQAERNPPVPL